MKSGGAKTSIPSASTLLAIVLAILAVVCCAGFFVSPSLDLPLAPLLKQTSAAGGILCFGAASAVLIIRFAFSPVTSGPQE
jgi:hypothetical protein